MTYIKKTPLGYITAQSDDGDLRVSAADWNRYVAVKVKLAAALAAIEMGAVRPLYVTTDQYDAFKAATKPGTWIVVRELERVVEASPTPASTPTPAEADAQAAPPVPAPAGPPVRPRDGRCTARSGLPHNTRSWVVTEEASTYHPGRLRVDGICQCGERLIDVGCPHPHQEMNRAGQAQCRDCKMQMGSQAGAIDNRNLAWRGTSPNGAADPNVALPIPPGMEENAPIDVYRAPGA